MYLVNIIIQRIELLISDNTGEENEGIEFKGFLLYYLSKCLPTLHSQKEKVFDGINPLKATKENY